MKITREQIAEMIKEAMHGAGMMGHGHGGMGADHGHGGEMMMSGHKGAVSREDCCAAVMCLVECCSCPTTMAALMRCCEDLMSGRYDG